MAQPDPDATASVLDLDHIDYSAFDTPVPAAEVSAFRAAAEQAHKANFGREGLRTGNRRSFVVALLLAFGLIFSLTTWQLVSAYLSRSHISVAMIVIPILFAFLTVGSMVQVTQEFADRHWDEWARLPRFARANGLQYRYLSNAPSYPGVIFRQGDSRTILNRLTSTNGRYFDLGNFEYWMGTARSRRVVRWGYLALRLDRKLPNMLLIAKQNQGLGGSDLPGTFHPDQVLSLEGDFDKYFTLYCPKHYETDALYIFTPDLMALLIDEARIFDVEIVDDWMFVVVRKPFPPASVATYERLFTIIRTVGAKTVSQSKNYHDARVGASSANTIAPPGRRLRTNVSPVRVVIMSLVLLILLAAPVAILILNEINPN
jgi:hypothetical protein